jgi:hypothetical protein
MNGEVFLMLVRNADIYILCIRLTIARAYFVPSDFLGTVSACR